MDIGPISAIRPVSTIRPSPIAPDLSRVYEVEYLGQSDDEYTAARKAARGLEDEEGEAAEGLEEETGTGTRPAAEASRVSFFA